MSGPDRSSNPTIFQKQHMYGPGCSHNRDRSNQAKFGSRERRYFSGSERDVVSNR
jgi:hypothetical protein